MTTVFFMTVFSAANASVYKCTSKDGKISYSETPCAGDLAVVKPAIPTEDFANAPKINNPINVKVNFSELEKKAENGDVNAQAKLGTQYSNLPTRYAEAVYWNRKAAEKGNAIAQYKLADAYHYGRGIPKDNVQGIYWDKLAAEQGVPEAQSNLGFAYLHGYVVPKDNIKAAVWYRKAADQGDSRAQFELGSLYETGNGVLKDLKQAVYWYQKAAAKPSQSMSGSEALAALRRLEYQTQENTQLKNVAKIGNSGLQSNSKTPVAEAVNEYRKAAEKGDPLAQFNLGMLYSEGKGITKNDSQAVYWFSKSANQGLAIAQTALSSAYHFGRGVSQDDKLASYWLEKGMMQSLKDNPLIDVLDVLDGQVTEVDRYGNVSHKKINP